MAIAQLMLSNPTDASGHLGYTLASNPRHVFAHKAMGDALLALHKSSEAGGHYREALRLKPDYAEAMDKLAWILATDSDPALRNGREAVRLAEGACRLTKYEHPEMLATLSAAHAELGDFKGAVEFARKAESLANGRGNRVLIEKAARLRREFEENRKYREQ
jgi:cytochrome c-type biogenesis protein CcmH/NrfG